MQNVGKQTTKNIIWNLIATIISFAISFFIVPLISNKLGIEAYGFVSLANTMVSYIDIIAVAVNAFSARYIAIAYHNGDTELANKYYNSVVFGNIIISVGTLTIGAVVIVFLDTILKITPELVTDVKILFALVLLGYIVNLFCSIFNLGTFIKNKIDINCRNRGLSGVLSAVLLGAAVIFGFIKVYTLAVITIASSMFLMILNYYYSKKYMPELHLTKGDVNFSNLLEIIKSGIWNTLNNIGTLLNTGLDLLVSNRFLNALLTGQISVGKQLSSIMMTFSNIIVLAFQPKQLEYYSKGETDKLVKSIVTSMRLSGIVSTIIVAGFCGLGLSFVALWLPNHDTHKIFELSLIILAGDSIICSSKPLYYIYTLTNKLKVVSFTTLIVGFLNFGSMVVLLLTTSIQGEYIVIGTTVVLNFISSWLGPYFAKKYLKLDKDYFSSVMIRHILSCALCCLVSYGIMKILPFEINSWLVFFGMVVAFFIIISVCCFAIETSNSEKKFVFDWIKTHILKRSGE